jgi:hypothetical protein
MHRRRKALLRCTPLGVGQYLIGMAVGPVHRRGRRDPQSEAADDVFVVFSGQVFRYPRGDRAARVRAEEHGRSVGVPKAQLDWPE